MMFKLVLYLTTIHFLSVSAQGDCTDLHGRTVTNGLHYIPGPDTCTLCICDSGLPKVCKAVLCSPPQDCRSFRVGTTCCEFICLDDVVKPVEAVEGNLRVAAVGTACFVLLIISFIVYKVRKQKRLNHPHAEDQRSLTSIGYISGGIGYMGGGCETAPGAWKPSGQYLPRGEAPPPYDEAIAQCRPDMCILNETAFNRNYPAGEPISRPDEALQCVGHGYVNVPRPVAQIANTQNCFNAPLLQQVHPSEARENLVSHQLTTNVMGFPSGLRLTGSLGAISNRALSIVRDEHERDRERERDRPHNVPGFYNTHTSLHRTIPRISTATDTSMLEAMCFSRAERGCGEVRRSFHRPETNRGEKLDRIDRADTGRSVPRNLNIASVGDVFPAAPGDRGAAPGDRGARVDADTGRSVPRNLDIVSDADNCTRNIEDGRTKCGRSRAQSDEQFPPTPHVVANEKGLIQSDVVLPLQRPTNLPQHLTQNLPQHLTQNLPQHLTQNLPQHLTQNLPQHLTQNLPQHLTQNLPQHLTQNLPQHITPNISQHLVQQTSQAPPPPPHNTLPLTVDKPSCGCSYSGRSTAAEGDEPDDYRSECENCKCTPATWVEGEGGEEWKCGTQTLQRRAPPHHHHTATLPQPVTRHERNPIGQPSNWENWFNTIPDSDSESEEE